MEYWRKCCKITRINKIISEEIRILHQREKIFLELVGKPVLEYGLELWQSEARWIEEERTTKEIYLIRNSRDGEWED